ncbi:MAG TPA: sigma-54 dependent transcriptional regulator [Rhizomicrobium sp.]|nr:sigma-54 dependent transcriptional regulator [Rhizomicrobium sp.]
MVSPARILVIDDEPDVLTAARLLLKRHFSAIRIERDPSLLPDLVRTNAFDVLLLDMNFAIGAGSGAEGLKWLGEAVAIDPDAVVVLITAHGDVELAVQAMKQGAADFIVKPWDNNRLVATLSAAANLRRSRVEAKDLRQRHRALAATLAEPRAGSELVGAAPAMLRLFEFVRRAAPTDANILILGENGTGKELVAREIHRLSARAGEAFIHVDLGAIPAALFESELFGHRRGAFTDAKEDRIGRFRAAAGGTLFLDEIGNVPLHLQAKLLAALERREIVPVGGDRAIQVDVRLIAATNLPRPQLSDDAVFRQDLFYRINTVEIALPPLRERAEDIPLLVEHFIGVYARKYNMPTKRVTAAALEALTLSNWPGNVRALRHAVERAMILTSGPVLDAGDFGLLSPAAAADGPLTLDSVERDTICKALEKHGGNISHAARALGLTRPALYRRMEKHGL